jgi:hypothetical protein
LTFWDGTQWVRDDDATAQPPRSSRWRDWAATSTILLVAAALIVPFSSSYATDPAPKISLSPAVGTAGISVTVTGTGFASKTLVQLSWDASATGMPKASINGHGAFKATLRVPAGAAGRHTVAAAATVPVAATIAQKNGNTTGAMILGDTLASTVFTEASQASTTPTPTPVPTSTPAATDPPTPTPKVTASPASTPLATPVATPLPAATPTPAPIATPTPTTLQTPAPTPDLSASPTLVGVGAGAWSAAADIKGSVSYVTLDTPSSSLITTYNSAGVAVLDVMAGPYSSGGVGAIDANAWAANAVATYRASPSILAIEVLNEPGGSWFWGSNALSQANASAYANLLKTVHNALVSAFGANRPALLASYDGGYSGGLTWGQMVWAADPNVASYIDGITVHPYGGTGSVSSSALGNRANVVAAHTATGLPVYITELGWPTAVGQSATGDSLQWSEADQATNIYNFVTWARGTGYVKAVVIFNYADYGSNNWYGIVRADQSHKKSYEDLRRAALGLPQSP